MNPENGNISIHTENIFPIIKKWLYSDKDIFVRELISNGVDAVSKLKRLSALGEVDLGEDLPFYVRVVFDQEKKTLSFIDNGIGMTAEEVKKYINQIAFSGAEDFIAKYQDQADEGSQIIGHFGLGFYSAFMVADQVQIDTLSYQKEAEAVRWICTGGTEYEILPSERKERGTTVTLQLAEDSLEFLEEFTLRQIIEKYCAFLPVEIFLVNAKPTEDEAGKEREAKPLNDTNPLWMRNPKDCTDQDYKEFYAKVFMDFKEPLFWIHLNVDYPFNLKGILYFPKVNNEFERLEGKIKLFNNQVFVADNIKEVIPEFLMLLKGVIDCSDLPLNVSRSFLQKDSNVIKISKHITKKVGDKLGELFQEDREKYHGYWDDINPFVKYGCLREDKFYDRVQDYIVYRTTKGDYVTLKEYLDRNQSFHENKVFYVSDEKGQGQYIRLFQEQGLEAVILSGPLDMHFIQFMEGKMPEVHFNRIDSDLSDSLKDPEKTHDAEMQDQLAGLFQRVLGNDKLKVQVETLKTEDVPAIVLLSEQTRRMQDMNVLYGRSDLKGMFPDEETLVLNAGNPLVQGVLKLKEQPEKQEELDLICRHLYDLAMLSHKQLEPAALTDFIARGNKILMMLAKEKN
ncbi:molecular chaperone HtpG [Dehalobacterium formicoaceticum]|uniref:Molecular chaperone HtpG n=1 Tax=Dehalobacterium formicoaceticum TaxID=51515 RepID=A0ABT1Y3L7_9FIRM|nr:molecular chaperone HtpG [Dehalobacterium formicoaceticum]MCR6545466.1 molecular chaperone HtpG [Dehalobacterium formicoaceticum]